MSRREQEEHYIDYLLGQLDEAARERMDSHLVECSECRHALANLEELLHGLPLALPESRPPVHVKDRVLEQVGEATRSRPLSGMRKWAIAASILLAAGAVATIALYRENQAQEAMIAALREENSQLRQVNRALSGKVNEMIGPGIRYLNLAGLEGYEELSGQAFIDPGAQAARIFFHNLPVLGTQRDFQLWAIEAGRDPHPSGVFERGDTVTEVQFSLPVPAANVVALAVTTEPAGGSPQPTGPMLLLGSFP